MDDLVARIHDLARGRVSLMEVCGTHTMAIGRHGLRSMMPPDLRLLSGPGCPVCVTPSSDIDRVIAMSGEPGVTVATFGDMMRVPGSRGSLSLARAAGADVRVVYSAVDAIDAAARDPSRLVVLFGVGFETTSPTVATTLAMARRLGITNLLCYPAFKLVPPAMEAILSSGETAIDGFLCPGHVSAVIGSAPYEPLSAVRGVPCVIAGFEARDILEAVAMLLAQIAGGRSEVEIQYTRAVPPGGNPRARAALEEVLVPCDAEWRGIGPIPGSGLELAPGFLDMDARARIAVDVEPAAPEPEGCSCGEVMRGIIVPPECPLFGEACVPASPVGPCMVSSEGACAAYMRYGGRET
jgi:hydrogenase expression/formation protein HypD